MIADVATAGARELWHNAKDDSVFTNINVLVWADGHLLFPLSPASDEWDRYWSLSLAATNPSPVMLTTTNGLIENATSAALSKDGRTFYYCTNAGDIERRHIWAVRWRGTRAGGRRGTASRPRRSRSRPAAGSRCSTSTSAPPPRWRWRP
jgi:hypothetical protein